MVYPEEKINCSFCGKRHDETKRIVKGNDCYICDECIFLCANIVHPDVLSSREELELRMFNDQVAKAYKDYLIVIRLVTGKKTWNDDDLIFGESNEESS